MAEVRMPQLGETVTEGTITRWFKKVGDQVSVDEALFEVSTEKVDSEVPSPISGVLSEIHVPEGETVEVGALLATVEVDGAEAPPGGQTPAEPSAVAPEPAPEAPVVEAPPEPAPPPRPEPAPPRSEPEPAPPRSEPEPAPPRSEPGSSRGRVLSPIVRRLMAEHRIDPAEVAGTGVGGRITRADVERLIQTRRPSEVAAPAARAAGAETRVRLNNIRLRTGEHMVRSKATSPHAVTIVEVDYERVEHTRAAHRDSFHQEEGFSLTYLPFVARAVIDAIEEYPYLNSSVGDGELIVHGSVNLSVAVDLDFEGLVAPVVRDADQKRLRFIAREIHEMAQRARSKQLSPDDIVGGTFTLTNAGSFGTHMVIPVINQPQVAILSTDGVGRKPVVATTTDGEEAIVIHSVGMLVMSWDHRAFDGAYAAAFLARVKQILETRDWEAEL